MTNVEISGTEVIVYVQGWHKLFAFKNELRVPLKHVERVARAKNELHTWKGWRAPGTSVPGVLVAGTFYGKDGRAFWDVFGGGDKAIAMYLRDDRFAKLIIDVEDSESTLNFLENAMAHCADQT